MRTSAQLALVIGALTLAVACDKKPSAEGAAPSATAAGATATAADAKTYFAGKCVVCHGEGGKGDGPGAAALDPKPRDFSDPKWQDSVTDEQIGKAILSGGLAVGKSAIMPPNPDLKGKDEMIKALVKHVRGFKR